MDFCTFDLLSMNLFSRKKNNSLLPDYFVKTTVFFQLTPNHQSNDCINISYDVVFVW
ncbi:hypothetical protein IC582_029153 [Cucumis melo]